MRQYIANSLPCSYLFWAAALLVTSSVRCSAQQVNTVPLKVEIAAASKTLSAGEPLVVSYNITNISPQPLTVRLGVRKSDWYALVSPNPADAKELSLNQYTERIQGFHALPTQEIGATGVLSGRVVLKQNGDKLKPGQHSVSINADIPYITANGEQGELQQSYPITFTIVAAHSSHLHDVAWSLQQSVLMSRTLEDSRVAISALAALPEAQAMPALGALASNPNLSLRSRKELVEQLSVVGTPGAVSLLAEMYWDPAQQLSTGFPGLDYPVCIPCFLRQLHETGSPAVKKQIEELFSAHGEAMP